MPKGGFLAAIRAGLIALFVLAVPVALIATNIRIAVSEQRVYDYAVSTYDAAAVSGIPESELLRANRQIHRYLTIQDPPPLAIDVTNRPGVSGPLFTAKETAHMADVQNLVQTLFTVQVISAASTLTLAVLLLVFAGPRALAIAALGGATLVVGVGLFLYGRHLGGDASGTLSEYNDRLSQAELTQWIGASCVAAGMDPVSRPCLQQ